ncbi:MAG: PRD domain-containing protein [Anaerorhabdus sp.]
MIVKKKINNNFAICLDSESNEIIAYGKGIGFRQTPYELVDLSVIERTFYDVDNHMLSLANQIPDYIFKTASNIVDMATLYLNCTFSQNLILSLSDHINFAIQRKNQGLFMKNPLSRDIKYLYDDEIEMGRIALKMIKKELYVSLPDEEAANIAVHFITAEAELNEKNEQFQSAEKVINDIIGIIEKELEIEINKNDINYSRFVIHLEYLLKRKPSSYKSELKFEELLAKVKSEYNQNYEVSGMIGDYIYSIYKYHPSQEDLLYLTLHINRLCSRV